MHVYMYQRQSFSIKVLLSIYGLCVGKKYFKGRARSAQSHGLTFSLTNLKPVFCVQEMLLPALNAHKVHYDLTYFKASCTRYILKNPRLVPSSKRKWKRIKSRCRFFC